MGHERTVLIVDDEPMARDVIEGYLFREGYRLEFAQDAVEALNFLEGHLPDVIVSDVMMPEMDGFELCRRLKEDKRWRHIPIILVTALDSKEDLVRGLEAGADDFLSKPVSEVEIRARVRSMLRIKQQYDELQAAVRLREDLANMIVHDMRTPLTAIMGFSSLLKDKPTLSPEDVADVNKIYVQAGRLSTLLHNLLMIAKTEHTGQLMLNSTTVDVNRLVRQIAESHQVTIDLRHINFMLDLPQDSPQVMLDETLFHRMLDNLVSNALKYTPLQSTVTVSVEVINQNLEDGPQIRLKVSDEGPGIPEEDRNRIFDKFETINLKQQGATQLGLGLAFCKIAVEAHGGKIFIESNDPTGSIFIIEI